MPNRLIKETSPYLLQHADNPVDWYRWGEKALQKARDEDKPIFLSIGYSACHWCHVMAHESFEDDRTAAILNKHFVNVKVECKEHLSRNRKKAIHSMLYEPYFNRHVRTVDRIMEKFRYHRPEQNIHKKAKAASKIISLANACGEGGLIPAEIADYARMGINNVVCLQPFGCISNHIIAKGIEKKIKKFYPTMNMLFLDFEADTSEVNVQNRLYFMIKNASGYTENRKPCTTKLSTAGIPA